MASKCKSALYIITYFHINGKSGGVQKTHLSDHLSLLFYWVCFEYCTVLGHCFELYRKSISTVQQERFENN